MKDLPKKLRPPVMAAGGIVVRAVDSELIAVVQMRKYEAWVLPKGKLARGETMIAAARREVIEETGYDVSVHEFLGTLAFEVGGRPKIVQFWRMVARGDEPVSALMRDVQAVQWLPLAEALEILTHLREREFLRNVGPIAIASSRAGASGLVIPAVEKPCCGDLVDRMRAWLHRLLRGGTR